MSSEDLDVFVEKLAVMVSVVMGDKYPMSGFPSAEQMKGIWEETHDLIDTWLNPAGSEFPTFTSITRNYNDWVIKTYQELQEKQTSRVLRAPKNDPVTS